jgi:hypothetical protein
MKRIFGHSMMRLTVVEISMYMDPDSTEMVLNMEQLEQFHICNQGI